MLASPTWRGVVQASDPAAELINLHDAGAGVYVTVNQTDGSGRKRENITAVRAVWQEDDDGGEHTFPLKPSMVIETSPGHHHRYWLVDGEWPTDEQGRSDFASVMGRMVETYGSDKNAKDISRVLRVPGFLHRKTDQRRMVSIVEDSGQRHTRAEIILAFPPVERPKAKTTSGNGANGAHYTAGGKREEIYARAALDKAAAELASEHEGGRNDLLNKKAFAMGRMVGAGWINRAEVADALWQACEQNGLTADVNEVQKTLASGLGTGSRNLMNRWLIPNLKTLRLVPHTSRPLGAAVSLCPALSLSGDLSRQTIWLMGCYSVGSSIRSQRRPAAARPPWRCCWLLTWP